MDDEEYGRLIKLAEEAEAEADEEEDKDEVNESEDEEEEVQELEDMTSPRISLSSWLGADGKTHHGVMIMDDTSNDNNKPQFDDCPICYEPFTSHGKHRICCLPCGHMYGLSCIKKWLLQSSSGGGTGKCPQCNTLCTYKDVVLLFASRLGFSARQKASSTRHFSFTEQGSNEFMQYELSRWVDAKKLLTDDKKKMAAILNKQLDACNKKTGLLRQWDDLSTQAEELEARAEKLLEGQAEELGQPADALQRLADALGRRADSLKRQADALGRRANAFGRRADALGQRVGVLRRRADSYGPSLKFFCEMLKEHLAQQKNTKPRAATAPRCHKH